MAVGVKAVTDAVAMMDRRAAVVYLMMKGFFDVFLAAYVSLTECI